MDENTIGIQCSEEVYREMPFPSYSLLSDIKKQGGELTVNGTRNKNINELDGVMVGKLVDNLITENKMPDNVFIVKKKPTGKAKDLLRLLAKNKQFLPNKDDLFHKDNWELINKMCDIIEYHKGGKIVDVNARSNKRLTGLKNYEEYFNILSKCPEDSFIISEYLYYSAIKVVDTLKKEYPMLVKPEEYGFKIIPQVKLLGKVNNIEIKGMLDFVVIDDENKVIYPYDLKTGSGKAEEFFENGYLGWNYYIQSSLYLLLLKEELKNHPIYKDYEVKEFRFMYISRMHFTHTVMTVTQAMHENALKGFEINGEYYKGTNELLNEYVYYKSLKSGDIKHEDKNVTD